MGKTVDEDGCLMLVWHPYRKISPRKGTYCGMSLSEENFPRQRSAPRFLRQIFCHSYMYMQCCTFFPTNPNTENRLRDWVILNSTLQVARGSFYFQIVIVGLYSTSISCFWYQNAARLLKSLPSFWTVWMFYSRALCKIQLHRQGSPW